MRRAKRRSDRRPIPTLAEREARAREVTAQRRRRDSIDALNVRAQRGRILLADVRGQRLERAAAARRDELRREAIRARLQPVHERLVALARADLLAAIHDSPESFEWEPACPVAI